MRLHHHHVGDQEFLEHFDIDDPDPTDIVEDNIVVHAHEVPHSDVAKQTVCLEDCLRMAHRSERREDDGASEDN